MDQYLKITIPANPDLHELLIAELDLLNYDSFLEKEGELEAFIQDEYFVEKLLQKVLVKYKIPGAYTIEKLENVNWNEQWENNFDPVNIEDRVFIRASFHQPQPNFDFEIVIDPKMSFGTGHHQTTYLMISEQLNINHKGKRFLDIGTGTGVLGIMAYKLGAKSIIVTDIDDWCIENCRENFKLNSVDDVEILKGTIDKLTLEGTYDIICANINKNILLDEIPIYAKLLSEDGILLLSGFYIEDMEELNAKATECQLKHDRIKTKKSWAMETLSHAHV